MPEIQLKHVVSCNSEDRNNPAENLLKPEGTHKWRTATGGEKNASVVIQFEKSSQIHSLDIGNEGSAFVEVLVGKSTSSADTDFQVLLVSSAFMSPAESRNNTNRNAVRIFGPDKLSKTVVSEKWDRVKIVCTQPFNKTHPYGLSFIKFHSPPDPNKPGQKEGVKKLGAFIIKKDEEEEDEIKTGTLFASRGKKVETASPPPPSGAAAVNAASRLAEESRASTSRSPGRGAASASAAAASSPKPTASSPKATPKTSPAKGRQKHAVSDEDSDTEEDVPAPPRTTLKRQSTSLSSVASSRSSDAPPPLKKTKTEPPKSSPAKVFSRLMEKVVFVLSGFQNPYRGELREKALEMGAQYKPDWGKGCTHLVCAFPNTPKYNQVKGRGRIVSKQWIIDCHKQKKLLPWRKYRLGDAESPDESSDDEDEILPPSKTTPPPKKTQSSLSKKGSTGKSPASSGKRKKDDDSDIYGGDTDSADDTDEEIRRAKEKAAAKQKASESKKKDKTNDEVKVTEKKEVKAAVDPTLALYGDSTDEDEPAAAAGASAVAMDTDDGADSGLPDLPDFFADKHFFFYGDFDAKERRLLTRYIAAYDGVLEDYMNDRVKYVVTSAKWDDNFEEALSENPGLVFVKPKWIHVCHEKNKLVPHQPYIVVP